MSALKIDLATTPFSRRGSYFAVSRFGDAERNGIYLRTVHGDARRRELLRLLAPGATEPSVDTTAGRLVFRAEGLEADLALDGAGRAVLRVLRGALTLDFHLRSTYDVVLEEQPAMWRFTASGANRNYRIVALTGTAILDTTWDGLKVARAALTIAASDAPAIVVIDEYMMSAPEMAGVDLDTVAAEAEREFEAWQARHAPASGDADIDAAARLAAYVTWSTLVPAGGLLRRESMLMSKNGMTHIWAWDHCFNAIALWRDPAAAADQLLTLFDHQDAAGALPDHIDDARIQPNFTKPPIHGWAVGYLMDRDALAPHHLAALYAPLARWTDWWFAQRVFGDDGVPSYCHGNDSGWDNATVFAAGVPVQSPDLLAFLALQMHALARIAERLGLDSAAAWRQRADAAIRLLRTHFWRGDRFVARNPHTGQDVRCESLLLLMPLTLGADLPRDMFDACVERLEDGGYLTAHGIATEPTSSPYYVSDGYWRGPVWAPTTMLLVDGLRRGGRRDLADHIARNFVCTIASAGMAENFDALTGQGLRDGAMTWTASVYLALLAQTGSIWTSPA